MTVSIVACGESGSEWYKTPCDYSIGVNDCAKWMCKVNELLIVNSPKMFEYSRLEMIKTTKFDKVKTNSGNWDNIFPQQEIIRLQGFSKVLIKDHIYSSKTSSFVAMSLAYNYGATEIIFHGHDLLNHPAIKDKLLNYEIRNTIEFVKILNERGVKVYCGKDNSSVFNKYLPTYGQK